VKEFDKMDPVIANKFEKNLAKLLSKYMMRELDPMKEQNPHVAL